MFLYLPGMGEVGWGGSDGVARMGWLADEAALMGWLADGGGSDGVALMAAA
jgi:hypothetical protein